MDVEKVLGDLHADCEWLSNHYEAHLEAWNSEIEALDKIENVFHSANYS